MTTASSLTQGGRKAPRAKKTTAAAKGRKTRAKKDDAVEVYDAESEAVVADEMPPAPKSTRGRKRKSDEVEDSVVTLTEAPAPKKRGRGAANNVESSVLQPDVEMAEAKPVKRTNSRKKGTKATRRTSATSTASVQIPVTVAAPVETLDDDELQQQLEADFDRPFSDIEDLAADSDSERFRRSNSSVSGQKKPATSTAKKHQSKGSVSNFAMFDPTPVMPDEAAVEAEFEALKAKVASEEADTIDVPKKGRKAGVRKVSKQKAKAQAEPEPEPEPAPMEPPQEVPQPAEELSRHVRIQEPAAEMALPSVETATEAPTKRGRGRPKKFNASNTSSVSIEGGTMASASRESLEELPPRSQPTVEPPAVQKETSRTVISRKPLAAPQPTASQERSQQAHPGTPLRTSRGRTSASQPEPAPDTASRPTPATSNAAAARAIVATPSARQAQLSPSQSPQASDAENQPPSSRADLSQSSIGAGTVLEAKRVVLAPAGAVTPVRNNAGLGGYANNNVVGGLRSTEPWTAVDLDLFLESCGDVDKENATAGTLEAFSNLTKGAVLTSPERRMTVEEWILYNAGLAERRLRMECEAVVSAFEREGGRAMRALEGVIVE